MIKMKEMDNKRVLILSDLESPYFEQTIFILKQDVIREEDKLVNEARAIVERYVKKYEAGYTRPNQHKLDRRLKWIYSLTGILILGLIFIMLFLPQII